MTNSLKLETLENSAAHQPGRRERRRKETRERIFRAAMQLFAEHGFFNTTVEDITEAADVGKGTFFNYFPSKEHVLTVLHDIQLSKVESAVQAARAGEGKIHKILRELMERVAEEPARSQPLARGLIATLFSSDPVRDAMVGTMARGRKMLEEILQRGQERGEIRADLRLEDMALAFQQYVFGTVLLWSITPPSSLKKRLDTAFAVFWSGVGIHR
jgi:AcrR family transcriptional regulator